MWTFNLKESFSPFYFNLLLPQTCLHHLLQQPGTAVEPTAPSRGQVRWWRAVFLCTGHRVLLFGDPVAPLSGMSQAGILELIAIFFTRASPWPRDWTCVSCIGRQILYHWAIREAFPKTYSVSTFRSLLRISSYQFCSIVPEIDEIYRVFSPWHSKKKFTHGRRQCCAVSSTTQALLHLAWVPRRQWQPLQCSCLENPRDAGPGGLPSAGSQTRTRLKRISSGRLEFRSTIWSCKVFLLECVKWLGYSRSLKVSHVSMFQNHMNGIRFSQKERSNSTKINYFMQHKERKWTLSKCILCQGSNLKKRITGYGVYLNQERSSNHLISILITP